MSLPSHLEAYLGPIEAGWQKNADGAEMPFQVARFAKGSGEGTISFATLGLSNHALDGKTKKIHQELLMIMPETLRDGPVPGILQQVGAAALSSNRALLRGDILGPRGQLFPNSSMEALYVSIPVYLPDEFAVYAQGRNEIVMAWLVPISGSEARFAHKHGWREFEDRLAEIDPDLTDAYRQPVPL